jgi:hypothetical protein
MKHQWAILLDEFELKSKTHLTSKTQQGPGQSRGLDPLFSCCPSELPSATGRQNDRLTLRKQFLAQISFAV